MIRTATTAVTLACCLGLLMGCATGQKAYRRGEYTKAVYQATKRLKRAPDNEKSLDALSRAYPAAQECLLQNIERAERSPDPFKWEPVVSAYGELNRMADAIRTTPAAHRLLPNPTFYGDELHAARTQATEARYQAGASLLSRRDRMSARDAMSHFAVADRLMPGYKDVKVQLEAAQKAATVMVVFKPVQCASHGVDIAFLQDRLHTFLSDYRPSEFVRFHSTPEARRLGLTSPDEVVELQFDQFVVGDSRLKEKVQTHEKDGVIVGRTRSQPPQDVVGTVKADVTSFETSVATRAKLSLRIVDGQTQEVLLDEELPGENVWSESWATFRGDERAVPEAVMKLVRDREPPPPSRQVLFEALAEHLFEKASNRIRAHYQRYR